jgi:hypothetical protein
MLTVPFTRGMIDEDKLTACQEDAAKDLYALAMSAFIYWLAAPGRLDAMRAERRGFAKEALAEIQELTAKEDVHPRHPGVYAELISAYKVFHRFAVESGALGCQAADRHRGMVERSLAALVIDQGEIQRERQPGRRFLALVAAGLSSLRFHLVRPDTDAAPQPYAKACGWDKGWVYQGANAGPRFDWEIPENSKKVGFVDTEEGLIYLDPENEKIIARAMSREQGDLFENAGSIGRDLAEANLIETAEEGGKTRYTIHKRFPNAGKQRYFVIRISDLFGDAEETPAGEAEAPGAEVAF